MSRIGTHNGNCNNYACKKMIREKRLPFEVNLDPFYSESNLKALDKSIQQIKEGKIVVKTLEELEKFEND